MGVNEYKYKLIKPKARKPENKPDGEELAILNRFLADHAKNEESRTLPSQEDFYYYGRHSGQQELPAMPRSDQGWSRDEYRRRDAE